ncbi:thrombospondin type 3 repeat-containing protein [Leptospira sp. FAT2]|uniref:thrombospondin type 3 repeat-containing protein n=1 Tax=Leptospira sanjuanensis TaxID=2879643 RepID=UPI001EE89153|nr:thrombospondin type 3 repeat-containing protein [Leptospira sanjuanensis]MCG6194332.1 thrombospondin type 3 repeat-containing protein [Leptospira sanjuanensis]
MILPQEIPSESLRIQENSSVPQLLGKSQVPIGKIYDIHLELTDKKDGKKLSYQSLYFSKPVRLEFPVDLQALEAKGFTKEFYVWYRDFTDQKWKILQKGALDEISSSVSVETRHFTPFLLTALPVLPDTGIAGAPACFTNESASWNPQGILDDASASRAKFGTIGEGYQYLQDRPYFVKVNEGAFRELGLELSLLFPTCQGGAGTCGNSLLHTDSNTSEYLSFNAVKDIDVYVMYDSRGAALPADSSQDADWLQSDFTLLSGKYIYTTDPGLDPSQTPGASGYKIYKRSYTQGSRVVLGGNKKGTSASGISSNYWVLVKPANTEGSVLPSSTLCASGPDPNFPQPVVGSVYPGADKALLYLFYPDTNSPKQIVIRRSEIAPPMSPALGEPPSGTEVTPYSFIDTGLVQGHTYYYSVFALNKDGYYNSITIGMVTTGQDSDGDGLTDDFEINFNVGNLFENPAAFYRTDEMNPDTDGDGTADMQELANGTDPTKPDTIPPTFQFRPLANNASSGYLDYQVQVDDASGSERYCFLRQFNPGMTEEEFLKKPFGVFHSLNRPLMSDGWRACFPNYGTFELGKSGSNLPDRFAVWGRDDAGNITGPSVFEFKMWESKKTKTISGNAFSYASNNPVHQMKAIRSIKTNPDWNNGKLTSNYYPIFPGSDVDLSGSTHILLTEQGELESSITRIPSFLSLSKNKATFYSQQGSTLGVTKVNEVGIEYSPSPSGPKPVVFPIKIGTDQAMGAVSFNGSKTQSNVFKTSTGVLTKDTATFSSLATGVFPSAILPFDYGQSLGIVVGTALETFLLDSYSNALYKHVTSATTNSDLSGAIASSFLSRYNPQGEAEVFATLSVSTSTSTSVRIFYRKSGRKELNSFLLTGIPATFVGKDLKFYSYLNWSGQPEYRLSIFGRNNPTSPLTRLLNFKIDMTSGIPVATFNNASDLTYGEYQSIEIDSSGRYLFGKMNGNSSVNLFINGDDGPIYLGNAFNSSPSFDLQLSIAKSEEKGIGNVGGYSKIRVLDSLGYIDYLKYGFFPANSDLIFRHNYYDSDGNDCVAGSPIAGISNVTAAATGNYGIPPQPLAITSDTTITNAQKLKAPSSAATLILESSFTQGSAPCRGTLIARDSVEIPVRKKETMQISFTYNDTTLNPNNVPNNLKPTPEPAAVKNAEFKVWEQILKKGPTQLGTYIQKRIFIFGAAVVIVDEANPCIIHGVTIETGRSYCNNYFGGYPLFVENFYRSVDQYLISGKYIYSGDKLIPAP